MNSVYDEAYDADLADILARVQALLTRVRKAKPEPLLPPTRGRRMARAITHLAAGLCGVSAEDVERRDRRRAVAQARQLTMWALRTLCKETLVEVGILMGRDHGSVLHAVGAVNGYTCIFDIAQRETLRGQVSLWLTQSEDPAADLPTP